MALNEQRKRFCLEYLIDLNATQAAIRAGYSERTAYSSGQRLLKNVEVQDYINKILHEKEDALIAKQDEVLKTLTRIMRREELETVVVTVKKRKSYYDERGKKVIDDIEEALSIQIPTKVSDANKAAELLGRYYTLFTDKLNIDGDLDFKIQIDYGENGGGTDEEHNSQV
jgi:phage terminase small subunit|nr:MAG TPA: Terminase small subunit [Caudoviricetes sp.]